MAATVIDVELQRGDAGLGFNIKGGVDNPQVPGDSGIFVAKIRENGAAAKDKRLQEGDKIIEINGVSLECVTHLEAVNQFLNAGETVKMKIQPGALQALKDAYLNQHTGSGASHRDGTGIPWVKVALGVGAIAAISVVAFKYYKSRS